MGPILAFRVKEGQQNPLFIIVFLTSSRTPSHVVIGLLIKKLKSSALDRTVLTLVTVCAHASIDCRGETEMASLCGCVPRDGHVLAARKLPHREARRRHCHGGARRRQAAAA